MTNKGCFGMTKDILQITNIFYLLQEKVTLIRHSSLVIRHSSFIIRHSSFIIRHSSFVILFILLSSPAAAQTELSRPVIHATTIGLGANHQLDTYLSPLDYHGPQLQLMHETQRITHLLDSAVTFQTLWQGNLSYTKNASAKARYMGGDVTFDAAWHYRFFTPVDRLRLFVGPQIGANVGVLYNTRNGNNPAQALASADFAVSAAAAYDFRIWRQPLLLRYQLDIPLLGVMFSPNYGQSYYELFTLGNTDHNVCFTHPGNAFSNRHLFSIDVPLHGFTLRASYLCDIRQSHVNEIKHHSCTHAFMLGWVRYFQVVHPRRSTPPDFVL